MQQILLLGDSLTEQGFSSGWVSRLSDAYVRRADVLNRGLSGYNTRWLLSVLRSDESRHHLFPEHVTRPLFVTILIGTNDCSLGGQGVPLQEFKGNLRILLDIVRKRLSPIGGIFLMTPPPINGKEWNKWLQDNGIDPATGQTPDNVLRYRDAVAQIGLMESKEFKDVTVIDLHDVFLGPNAEAKGGEEGPWCKYFSDGLHFNEDGGKLVYDALMSAIRRSACADCIAPENITPSLPDFMVLMKG
uniref:Putative esterase n=1 Tax=Trypanosoma congolense (strain IL3000) TaxID=1068625 RepID=G0UJH9_TRYCI|nr:putative esterase [Trypanosoma congolense IL3000]